MSATHFKSHARVEAPGAPPLETLAFTRLAFGPTPADVAAYRALPGATPQARFERWLDAQLTPAGINDSECDRRLRAAGLNLLNRSQHSLWDEMIANNKYKGDNDREYQLKYLPTEQAVAATYLRARYSKRQLLEVMVDFWHNHFHVYPHETEEIFATWPAYDSGVIRANALGNFRVMLEAVARSLAMQQYLNNATNRDEGPNENFARELLELHTLGAQHYIGVKDPDSVTRGAGGLASGYVDNDVYEVARCFTGWTYDFNAEWWNMTNTGAFLYKREWHDRFNKRVLGRTIPNDQPDLKDGLDVLDLLATHPGTAQHIALKLCRRLLSDHPPKHVVDLAAKVFLGAAKAPDQLRQVVRAIALSPEFAATFGEKIRRPFEAALAMLRSVDADVRKLGHIGWYFEPMGQQIFGHRAPDGFPDTREAWVGTVSMLFRWRFAIALTDNWMNDDVTRIDVDVAAQTPEDKRAPAAAVEYWSDRILMRQLPLDQRGALTDLIKRGGDDGYGEYLNRAVQLIFMSPDFQLR